MYTIYLQWELVEQDEIACSSIIKMHSYIVADDPLMTTYGADIRYFDVKITDFTGEHTVWYSDQVAVGYDGHDDIFTEEYTEIAHVYDGTGNFTISVDCSPIGDTDTSFSGQFQLQTINVLSSITGSQDNIIGQNATLSVVTRNGFQYTHDVVAVLNGTDTTIASGISAGNFTWNTSTYASSIYASIPNSSTANITVKCITKYGGSTIGQTTTTIPLQADPVASAPQITGASYQDTNATTVAITSNNQKIVRGHSVLQMLATAIAAKYSATLTQVDIYINGTTTTDTTVAGQSSVASWTKSIGTLDVSSNVTADITVTDSRGLTTTVSITVQIINYVAPKADCSARRVDNYYTATDLKCSATFSSIDGHNSGTITMAYKKTTDGSYPSPETITSGTTYQRNLDNAYRWNVKFVLTDLLETTTYILTVDVGMPLVFFDHVRSSFGVNCFPKNNNSIESEGLQVDNNVCIAMATLSAEKITITGSDETICYGLALNLITGLFNGITVPPAYTKKYKLSAQISTSSTNTAKITMGGISSNALSTGGNSRKIVVTDLFSEADLTQDTTPDGSGLLLKGVNTGTGTAYIYNVTIACYLAK